MQRTLSCVKRSRRWPRYTPSFKRAGRSERERLALELTKLSQSKQVTQAYTSLG